MSSRTELRRIGRTAMATAFPALTEGPAWGPPTNAERLPIWAFSVPQERSELETYDTLLRTVVCVATITRSGKASELEDLLDADAAKIESLVLPDLNEAARLVHLTETSIEISSEGAQRLGRLVLRISAEFDTALGY